MEGLLLATVVVVTVLVGRFIWNDATGMRDLKQLLIDEYDLGEQLAGFGRPPLVAFDISPDGLHIVGNGLNPDGDMEAWLVHLGSGARAGVMSTVTVPSTAWMSTRSSRCC